MRPINRTITLSRISDCLVGRRHTLGFAQPGRIIFVALLVAGSLFPVPTRCSDGRCADRANSRAADLVGFRRSASSHRLRAPRRWPRRLVGILVVVRSQQAKERHVPRLHPSMCRRISWGHRHPGRRGPALAGRLRAIVLNLSATSLLLLGIDGRYAGSVKGGCWRRLLLSVTLLKARSADQAIDLDAGFKVEAAICAVLLVVLSRRSRLCPISTPPRSPKHRAESPWFGTGIMLTMVVGQLDSRSPLSLAVAAIMACRWRRPSLTLGVVAALVTVGVYGAVIGYVIGRTA